MAKSARTGTPVDDVADAMPGVHALVLPTAELPVGPPTDGVTRADVRTALWTGGGRPSPGEPATARH